jgi:hypothetical protein
MTVAAGRIVFGGEVMDKCKRGALEDDGYICVVTPNERSDCVIIDSSQAGAILHAARTLEDLVVLVGDAAADVVMPWSQRVIRQRGHSYYAVLLDPRTTKEIWSVALSDTVGGVYAVVADLAPRVVAIMHSRPCVAGNELPANGARGECFAVSVIGDAGQVGQWPDADAPEGYANYAAWRHGNRVVLAAAPSSLWRGWSPELIEVGTWLTFKTIARPTWSAER